MFSSLAQAGLANHRPIVHRLLTTRRGAVVGESDELRCAAETVGLECRLIPERHLFDTHVLGHMTNQIRDFDPDIIETHDCKSHFLLYLLRLRYPDLRRKTWLAFHHGYTRASLRVALYQQLDRLSLPRADHVVTVCRPFAETLATRGVSGPRISVVSNSLAPRDEPLQSEARELRGSLGVAPNDLLILSVGRLSKEKAHSYLIEALADVVRLRADAGVRLVLVGDGPERGRLQSLATRLGVQVLFAGHVRDPWVFYRAADIFVLCSLTEGSPLVLLEAMAAELPIVASAVGGIPDTLSDGKSGLLIPPADRSALGRGLISLVEDSSLRERLGRAAGRAVQDYSPQSYANTMLGIYARLLAS
jgi:glycosyltransferase involved in cell wall biosynthesis